MYAPDGDDMSEVSATAGPWSGICLDDGTGRGVYYISHTGHVRKRDNNVSYIVVVDRVACYSASAKLLVQLFYVYTHTIFLHTCLYHIPVLPHHLT